LLKMVFKRLLISGSKVRILQGAPLHPPHLNTMHISNVIKR